MFAKLQNIGKSLMTPVAVLPVAGLLLRLGAPDVLNIKLIEQAGGVIFDSLPTLFAIGIAFGISKNNHGVAALSGYVGYIVMTKLLVTIDPEINMGVLAGIITGFTAGTLYNRYRKIKLPDYLGFFGGTRFIPIATAIAAIFLAIIFGFIWPPIQNFIKTFGDVITNNVAAGIFIYGFLNRLLIPLGLHHILNSFVWFVFGEYTDPVTNKVITGDLNRFFAGDPTAGFFMAGGFPIMMFGLPAVCLAIYHTANPKNRKKIFGILFSAAFTSFLTGITEPIEFLFLFIAPALYIIHSLLHGLSMLVCYSLDVRIGYSFSNGAIDYILNWGISGNPELIIPIGLFFAAVYYHVFKWAIVIFNLQTVGRYEDTNIESENISSEERISKFIESLGGADNFVEIENCVTRLRLVLKDSTKVNESELKKIGALGVVRKNNAVQVIVGTQAEHIADDIKNFMGK